MVLKWLLFAILMAFDGLFLAAVGTKYLEVKRVSRWSMAPGRVTSSRSVARKVDRSTGTGKDRVVDSEIRNFATISYTFDVGGKRQTGNRIGVAHDVGNVQVAEKLKKYPVGAAVSVFYDPENPSKSLLERDMPARSFEIALLIGSLVALAAIAAMLMSEDVGAWLTNLAPNGQGPAALLVAAMGAFAAIMGYNLYQQGQATQAWSRTEGQITSSGVDKVRVSYLHWRPRRYMFGFRDRTIYAYTVNGVGYQSDRTSFGPRIIASLRSPAKHLAGRFSAGQKVEVFYNPKAPGQAVLLPGAPGLWLIWAVAGVLLGIAARLAGWL